MKTTKQILHERALQRFRSSCKKIGLHCKKTEYRCHYDMEIDNGARVEIKSALPLLRKRYVSIQWLFNIHRHGKISPLSLDFYALYCQMPKGPGIWFIVPFSEVPKGEKTIAMGLRTMATRWGKWEGQFELLKAFSEKR